MQTTPPKLANRLLLRFLRDDLREEVLGDLEEKFYVQEKKSLFRAKLNYWYQVFNYLRPFAIGKSKSIPSNYYAMYQSYFRVGWRNLLRNKGYSSINIGGLAIGMAVAMLIGLWINDELEYNTYYENYSTIGRVLRNGTLNGETFTSSGLPLAVGEELSTKYGDNFKHVVMVSSAGDHILSSGENKFTMQGIFLEAAGPEMFSLKMLSGSLSGLNDPHSIMLSQSAAKTFFGDDNPLDKLFKIDGKMEAKVTGVYEDLPYNAQFHGTKFFAPHELFVSVNQWMKYQGFGNNFLNIYVSIADHKSFEEVSFSIKDVILNNIQNDKGYVAINPQLFVHPMEKWHMYSEWKNGVNTGGLVQIMWLFGIVGGFVLLLACINFMNLSTARSEKRAKEVGTRKVMGSMRSQLMSQFFAESFVVVILAFVFTLVIVALSLPWFNELSGKQITMPWLNLYFWASSFIFILFTGLLAGSYPAIYLSSFNPVRVLKGSLRIGRFASIPRKVLVVVQFTVSITLIIGTIIVYQQVQFAKNRPVGYNQDGLLMIAMTSPDFFGKYDLLRTELKNTGVVTEMGECSSPPTDIWNSNGGFEWKGKDPAFQAEFATYTVTPEYGKTLGWEFISGRDFSRDLASDSNAFIINEAAAKIFGYENPVGEVVQYKTWWTNGLENFTVIGVIKDMIVRSPYAPPFPSVFHLKGNVSWISIRIDPKISAQEALPKIEAVFKKVIPSVPFDYKFTDQEYALKFITEERVGKLASVFAVLAILISCLGLFGLASFVAAQRTKEIGIRKVVGASVFSLWKMLSKDFVVLVVISCIIAVPIAYYFLASWLKKYEYRTEMSWWIFATTCAAALVITLLTVSHQAIKAAMMNPVNSLKSE